MLFSLIFLFNIEFKMEHLVNFNLMVLIVITFDIFSYFVGSLYGKRKFLGYISPNKTIEGLIGGIFFTILISIFYSYLFQINFSYILAVFILLIIFSSFLGDIIESIFKRANNIKNSSNLLLGHGGFFDRFDSFVLSLVSFSLLYKLL